MLVKKWIPHFLLIFSFSAFADEGVHTSIHRHYQSPRALGIGGAFVAIADDYNALFYNPAGLARLEENQVNLSLEGGVSVDQLQKFFADVSKASETEDANLKFTQINSVLQSAYGKQFSFRFGLFHGIWARPGFAFGVLPVDFTMDVKVHNQAAPAINLRAFADSTIAFGFGDHIKTEALFGRLSWGVTTKFINRGYANKQANALTLVTDSSIFDKDDLRWGYTFDFDFGILYSPVVPSDGLFSVFHKVRPTVGLVVRNLVDSGFGQSLPGQNAGPVNAPEKLNRVLDLGLKFELPQFWIFGWRMAADVQDIGHPSFTFRKGFHVGAEFDWTVSSWWRGQYRIGAHQGYPTLGASFLFSVLKLDLLTYGEDYGSFSNPKENRMYMIKTNLDF